VGPAPLARQRDDAAPRAELDRLGVDVGLPALELGVLGDLEQPRPGAGRDAVHGAEVGHGGLPRPGEEGARRALVARRQRGAHDLEERGREVRDGEEAVAAGAEPAEAERRAGELARDLCWSRRSWQQDTCQGDSGGPLLIGGAVAGVTLAGDANCTGFLSWDTSVVEFLPWITSMLL
jgi:Trypsin